MAHELPPDSAEAAAVTELLAQLMPFHDAGAAGDDEGDLHLEDADDGGAARDLSPGEVPR